MILKLCQNKLKYDILGYKVDELIDSSFLELVHPEDRENTIREMQKLSTGGIVNYFENRYQHKDGRYIVLGWSANTNENNSLIYASAHNVTKLKKNEKLVFQQSKMASMGEMLENIAHQWRQPLSIISALSSSLEIQADLDMLDRLEVKESMDRINLNVQHLSTTIDTFRSFYKSDKMMKQFTIKEVFEKTLKLASSQFRKSEITIIEEIDHIVYRGFENELIQVIINIINNARDELIKMDNIRLLILKASIKNKYIHIEITDNAGGIPDAILAKIFDAHFSTKTDSDGSGIGLYMSKTIVEEHMKGNIVTENIEFKHDDSIFTGAKFSIILPLLADK